MRAEAGMNRGPRPRKTTSRKTGRKALVNGRAKGSIPWPLRAQRWAAPQTASFVPSYYYVHYTLTASIGLYNLFIWPRDMNGFRCFINLLNESCMRNENRTDFLMPNQLRMELIFCAFQPISRRDFCAFHTGANKTFLSRILENSMFDNLVKIELNCDRLN